MEFNSEDEKREALNRLKEKKEARLLEINDRLKKMRDAVADQKAIIELYTYRDTAKGHKGYNGVIREAIKRANELENNYEERRPELEREKQILEIDLESLNELLK